MTAITTQAELAMFPVGTVLRANNGWLAERTETTLPQCWQVTEGWRVGSWPPVSLIELAPLTVLHVPGRQAQLMDAADTIDRTADMLSHLVMDTPEDQKTTAEMINLHRRQAAAIRELAS